ncbi:S41 family peptidase [Bacillus sp. 03113]|uniref:S41 family peptidase n=1 Tax=Bacillus sp. 03113 TaxID=2578211 RepID=UPI0011437BA8|nr:S41 family peptidase [Bacillus sp. 03113]
MNRKLLLLFIGCSLLIGAGGTYAGMSWFEKKQENAYFNTKSNAKEYPFLSKVSQAYELIYDNYVEEVNRSKLAEGAIQGMLSTLNDPYSVYMNQEVSQQFNRSLKSSFEGIGAEMSMEDGKMIIVAPFKNSPAEKAGLKANDQILKVDGVSVKGLDLYETTLKIRGVKGTVVKLEVARQGLKKPMIVSVKRDEIPHLTVNADVKEYSGKKIGYIAITSFSENTAIEMKKELTNMEKDDIQGLIMDVRGNPGGYLSSVQEILQEFVTKKKPYIQIEKRNGDRMEYFSQLEKKKSYPISVLIDQGSASASEILAGALHEAEGYPLVGEKTFGKGTVQEAVPMKDGSQIKLTLYKWLTPNGVWIHKKGIEPTIEVKQPELFHNHPIQLEKTLEPDMNNEQIKIVQQILDSLGLSPGRKDGYFSERTATAVKAFQQQHDLKVTGFVDKETASILEKAVRTEIAKEENDLQLQIAIRITANKTED